MRAALLSGLVVWLGLCVVRAEDPTAGGLRPAGLRCDALVDPLGIGEAAPQLSWLGQAARRAEVQTAYQILVASSADALARNQGDLWDSGQVHEARSAHIVYAGKPLASRAACFWKVRLWDRDGQPSPWSEPAQWSVGLLVPADWTARWIDTTQGNVPEPALPPIEVQRATYAASDVPGQSRDVTDVLREVVKNNRRDFVVRPEALGGDPAPGHAKTLEVAYTVGGQPVNASFPDGFTVAFAGRVRPPGYLRRTFPVNAPVVSATLYITALGLYEARLNGQRVGDHVLAPDWTDYNQRVRYQAYDVTGLLHTGDNALGVQLADGWYAGHLGNGGFQQYGTTPALLAQLEITRADGTVERIVSDASWKTHASPTLAADLLFGETYDARAELPAWDIAGFDDRAWTPATERAEFPRTLDSQIMPPVRALAERAPTALAEPAPGRWTFDLGQNLAGVIRLRVTAPAGTTITIRHAEALNPDGTLYTANLRGAASTDTYTCKGTGEETWQPRFTYHGFRYVEVSGLVIKPTLDTVTAVVLGTDNPRAGSFSCSDSRLSQLAANVEWSQRANFLSVPTDCPQRDERLGWLGDAQVFLPTALDLADLEAFFAKWLVDVDDAQHPDGAFTDTAPARGAGAGTPGWGDAGVICPWLVYQATGDTELLRRHLPAMMKWVNWCQAHSTKGLRDKDRGSDFGDWLAVDADSPKDVIATAYFAHSADLVARACLAVDQPDNATRYRDLFDQVRAAFNAAYIGADGTIKGDTQCVYALALEFGLLSDERALRATQRLADNIVARGNHLSTGFLGTSALLPTLTANDQLDLAYSLALQDTFPSWLYEVRQGATTIWERWDGFTPEHGFQDPGMNSLNHPALGSVGHWLFTTVAGIDQDANAAGQGRLVLHPRPGGGLTSARAVRQTPCGPVSSAWSLREGRFVYEVTIPANATASVTLPTGDAASVLESGRPLAELKEAMLTSPVDGQVTFSLGSGSYRFLCPLDDARKPR